MSKKNRPRGYPADPTPALPVPVVDTHTHLDSDASGWLPGPDKPLIHDDADPWKWDANNAPTVDAQIARAAAAGVDRMVQVGCDLPSARWTADIVTQHPALVGAVALHPNEAPMHAGTHDVGPDGLEPAARDHYAVPLDEAIAEIAALAASSSRIRAIGETGMDLFRCGPQGAHTQRESFRAHIAIAKELDLALQIHDRDAHAEVLDILQRDGAPARTVFHCFSGDVEMARLCASKGWFLSFAGPITYPANQHLRDALVETPLDLLLAETDAPYLAPAPYRGQPNAPYVVAHTVRAMAEIRLAPLEDLCQALSRNSERAFGQW
ncbi:MAG: TatD family hydrolase [Cellulomonadaceae bacterium]|jgi:TatD DNase family protein|nr:TatD family hydrolase [Cellulomonadaceae bacterium]